VNFGPRVARVGPAEVNFGSCKSQFIDRMRARVKVPGDYATRALTGSSTAEVLDP
jgi:hypothetical protein